MEREYYYVMLQVISTSPSSKDLKGKTFICARFESMEDAERNEIQAVYEFLDKYNDNHINKISGEIRMYIGASTKKLELSDYRGGEM